MTQPDPTAQSGETGAQGAEGTPSGPPAPGNTGTAPEGAQSGAEPEKPAEKTVSQAEFDALRAQLQAADRKRTEAEQQLRAIRDKDLPEAEKVQRDLQEAQAENEKLKARVSAVALENAFLRDNTHRWVDSAAALKLADMSGVTIAEDGTVTGLKEALAKLAKSAPYLLDKAPTPDPAPTPGGGVPPMNGQPGATGPDKNGLRRRFPAMRTRRTSGT